LPPLPILSLDPTARLEQCFAAANTDLDVVVSGHKAPAHNRHTLLKLAGDLSSRRGLILSRPELHALPGEPDKRYLLAEARRASGPAGALLILGADPADPDFQTWWAVVWPALDQPAAYSLGAPDMAWPAGVIPLAVEFGELAGQLAVNPPGQPPAAPKYNINISGSVAGLTMGDHSQVEQHFGSAAPAGAAEWEAHPTGWEAHLARLEERLAALSSQLAQGVAGLKRGQMAIYYQLKAGQRDELAQLLAAVQAGRLSQAEMQATLNDLKRAMRVALNRGLPMAPDLRAAIADLTEAVESSLSLDQKLELALPLVPLLLNYKIELAAGSELDLHDLADDLRARWNNLLAKFNREASHNRTSKSDP
jgi:hypothetical protein